MWQLEPLAVKRPLRPRPQPQVVVHSRRNRFVRAMPHGFHSLVVDCLDHQHFADHTLTQQLPRLLIMRHRTKIGPVLHNPIVFSSGLHREAAFDDVVRRRFLAVHVLAGSRCWSSKCRSQVVFAGRSIRPTSETVILLGRALRVSLWQRRMDERGESVGMDSILRRPRRPRKQ